jgi:hypothetical protein
MKEIWKPLIRKGAIIDGYYVSNLGRIISSKKGKATFIKVQDREFSERGNCTVFHVSYPSHLMIDGYSHHHGSKNYRQMEVRVHQAVMEAFKPVDLYPPDELKNDWNDAPESFKQWVRDTVIIDHINDNPFDNKITNLRYTTPKGNNSYRKKNTFSDIIEEEQVVSYPLSSLFS